MIGHLLRILICILVSSQLTLYAALKHDALIKLDEKVMTPEAKAAKEEVLKKDPRAIFVQSIAFDRTTFDHANFFYLGAANQGSGSSSLVRAFVGVNTVTNAPQIGLSPLAPNKTNLNVAADKISMSSTPQDNPFFNSRISNLTRMIPFPILTYDNGITDPTSNQVVCMVLDVQGGTNVLSNGSNFLNDANGAQTSGILGLAATMFNAQGNDPGGLAFATVAPNGGVWGQSGSGVAVLNRTSNVLEVNDVQAGAPGNKAASIDPSLLTISGSILIDQTPQCMFWDSQLGRLYVGVSIRRSSTGPIRNTGGGVAILVGQVQGTPPNITLTFQPIAPLFSSNFNVDVSNNIFGFFFTGGTTDEASTIYNLRTMHTTTGRSYLIVNGGTGDGGTGANGFNNQMYALPVLDPSFQNATITPQNVGRLASKSDANALIATAADMTLSTDEAALIGGGPLPTQPDQPVEDMFVVGNAVFVCVAGDRTAPNREAGIFQSTALFDQTGAIRSWTLWRRVMGSVDTVFGAGLDTATGNYWYLTADSLGNETVVKVTQWGDGESNPGLLGGNDASVSQGFVGVMASQFLTTQGGVHQLIDFDSNTPGFAQGQFSMMVALGFGQVGLIESGRLVSGVFTPNKGDFVTNLSQNIGSPTTAGRVQIFNNAALSNLGPLCTAECSRIAANGNRGWLFVGGQGGLAVLSDTNGNGWDTNAGLNAGFQNISSTFTFKQIGNFINVKKIVSDGVNIYILTGEGLFRASMSAAKFSATPASLAEELIATPLGVTGSINDSFIDLLVIGSNALLATNVGLFTLLPGKDIKTIVNVLAGTNWQQVQTSSGRSLGSTNYLHFLPSADANGGNVFVTSSDLSLNVGVIYLFDIQNSGVSEVFSNSEVDYFYSIGEYRSSFFAQGGLGFHVRSKHFGDTNFLKEIRFSNNPIGMRQTQQIIDLGSNMTTGLSAGAMTYDSASGALLLPLDIGIKVNE